jgi:hypothetical protein
LAQKTETRPIIDKCGLDEFLKTAPQEPGTAVLDVVMFNGLSKEQMIQIGEDLADAGWRIIYWSVGVGADDVREDCWFEDRNNEQGVNAIVDAVNGGEFQNILKRGSKPDADELVLSLLSVLLPIGWLWELEGNDSRDGLLSCLDAPVLKGTTDFEQFILKRFMERARGIGDENWIYPRIFRELTKRLDKFIESRWDKISPASASENQIPPSGVGRALDFMAGSRDLPEWNENLTVLRDNLLSNKIYAAHANR